MLGALIAGLAALGYENLIAPALGIETSKSASKAYRKAHDEWEADTEAASKQHPLAFHATAVAAMVAPPLGALTKAARMARDRRMFFTAYPELKDKVWVHHAIPRRVLTKYPGLFKEDEVHALENLRGVPNELNNKIHQKDITPRWSRFYNKNPQASRQDILDEVKRIDQEHGSRFLPSLGESK